MSPLRMQSCLLLGAALLAGCSERNTATAPAARPLAARSGGGKPGAIQVTATTTGESLDPDGYTVAVDGGAAQALATNGSVTISKVKAGTHTVALGGVGLSCQVSGQNPLSVAVTSGETVNAAFQIACVRVPGGIAFGGGRDGNREIYVMNPDGSNVTRLTNNLEFDGYPAWSPDGTKIAFESVRNRDTQIYVMNADGSGVTKLTTNLIFNGLAAFWPAWSPDGTKIAFNSDPGDGYADEEIYVMNADGSGITRITYNPSFDLSPAWSPDGRIFFTSDRDRATNVYVMNADGSGVTRLTDNPAFDGYPAVSPDGTKIAFVTQRDGTWEVYSMNADGSQQTRLTNNVGVTDGRPAWSPDGTKIAFVSNRSGSDEIYVISADGSSITGLTNDGKANLQPAWSPR